MGRKKKLAAWDTKDWQKLASCSLKAAIKGRGLTYQGLTEALEKIGIKDTMLNVKLKIHRGTFSHLFYLQCTLAMDIRTIHLDDLGI